MAQRYSDVVAKIFASWLASLQQAGLSEPEIDSTLIQVLREMVENGTIGTPAEIRRLIEKTGGKNAA